MNRIFSSLAFFTTLFVPIFSVSTAPVLWDEFAANHSNNCLVEITKETLGWNGETMPITQDDDWASQMLVRGDDGFLWKRAVITSHTDTFELQEAEQTRIYGTAPVGSVVQVMFFPYVDNNENDQFQGVQIPDFIDGSCFQADTFTTDEAMFTYTVADQAFWGAMGEKMVFDAFYRTDIPWATYLDLYQADTNNNILVGSHVFPRILSMGGEMEIPEGCLEVCEGLTQGVQLNSGLLPAEFASEAILNDFDDPIVIIGRSDQHTYNSTFQNELPNVEKLRSLTHKSLTMEILKRKLLGVKTAPYGAIDDGIQALTVDNIMDGMEGRGTGPETQEILLAIRAVLTDDDEAVPAPDARFKTLFLNALNYMRINAIPALPPPEPIAIQNPVPAAGGYPMEPPAGGVPPFPPDIFIRGDGLHILEQINASGDENTIAELFPLQARNAEGDLPFNDTNWAETFLEIMRFWTGTLEINHCLMMDDRFIDSNFENHGLNGEIGAVCDHPYVSGRTPTILLHLQEKIMLEPSFINTVITKSNRYFTTENGWDLPAGKKTPIAYEYEFTDSFSPTVAGEACIAKENIPEYSDFLQEKLNLFENEKEIITKEISVLFEENEELAHIFIANPQDISSHITWNGNGKSLDIFQLFFDSKPGECAQKDFGTVKIEQPLKNRDGFEAGLFRVEK